VGVSSVLVVLASSSAAVAQPYQPYPQQYPQQYQPYPQYPQYPPQPPPPPPPPPPQEEKKDDGWPGVIGVRGSGLSVKGSDHDGLTTGATFTIVTDMHQTKDHVSWHGSFIGGLGGGTGGVEGGLGMGLAGGFRANFGEEHGPFARVGAMGELWGNDRFYFSRLELPMAEMGYQYLSLDDSFLFELGARAAPILGGRYDVGDNARRETGSSYEWGGYLSLHTHYGRLDVAYNRIELPTKLVDTPIDTIRGDACATIAKHIGLCLDGHFLRGDVVLPSNAVSRATTIYAGITIGYADW
jgi:hypothetical protein